MGSTYISEHQKVYEIIIYNQKNAMNHLPGILLQTTQIRYRELVYQE